MNDQLRILHLEDERDYSDFVREILAQAGINVELRTVSTQHDFESACQSETFSLILADYSLPDYSGLQALHFAIEECPDTPFILLSGTIGEPAAIESLRSGATDYVLKQWPERLPPAVQRAVHESQLRMRQKRAESALFKLGWQLNSATTQRGAARIIHGIADELFGSDAFSLSLFDPTGRLLSKVLTFDIVDGVRTEIPPQEAAPAASPMSRRVMDSGAELVLRKPDSPPPTDTNMFGDRSRPSASLMVVPLRSGSTMLGVLSVQSYRFQAYDAAQLELLQMLADHCGGALERIRAEQASREMESRFYELFDRSPDAIFVESEEGVVLDVNRAGCALHGLSRENIVGRHVSELVPPDRRQDLMANFKALVCGECNRFEAESWASDGRVIPVEVRTGKIRFAGKPALLLHVRDLTDRKEVESALRSSELLFYSVWENSVDGMRLTDEHGRIVAVNEAFCRLVQRPRTEVENRLFTEVFSEKVEPVDAATRYIAQFSQRTIPAKTEAQVGFADGRRAILEQSNSFVELRGRSPMLLSVFRDVTSQRRLEEQFRQSQKLEAIGQLAGGVAHDFNNILTVIHGHASMLTLGGNLNEPAARSARQIVQAADRAAGLTRQLLTFSRRQVMQTRQLNLNDVVRNITKLLGRVLGEDISLRVLYSFTDPLVQGDESMMEQVVMNLALNARDAMPSGGELTLEVMPVDLTEADEARHPDCRPGQFICLRVADTGMGISAEDLPHIFEPFFTTKAKGKGTGLGLATVYGVLKQHQGWVEVESVRHRGSIFRAYVPRIESGAATAQAEFTATPRGGSETILLVEDEEPVRELVCCLLEAQGYNVVEAESGTRALEIWEDCGPKVDLLLTDLVMPGGLNGRELAEMLRQRSPRLKVIYMSGYSADVLGKEFVVQPGLDFLQKPYDADKLASVVRDSLDGR
jgi:PAS domain S-box-containing protein